MKTNYSTFSEKYNGLTDAEKLRNPLYSHCRIQNCRNSKGVEYRNITIYWVYDYAPNGVISVGDCAERVFDEFEHEIGSYHTGLLIGEK